MTNNMKIGYESLMGTAEGDRNSRLYNEEIRDGTMRIAMLEQLRKPSKGFEEITRNHFSMKKNEILAQLDKWVSEATVTSRGRTGNISETADKLRAAFMMAL